MQHIEKIYQLRKKQARGQKRINCMGRRLDIDEAIGILVDEDLDKQNMEEKHYEEDNE